MSDVLEGLNPSQREAVLTMDRHVLVAAGPGTGKTLTIVRRISHLIESGVGPADILAVTFTNRAAREMRERVRAFMGAQGRGVFIGTLHLLGLRILRESGLELKICSREEQVRMVEAAASCSANEARRMIEKISRVKGLMEKPGEETARVLEAYQQMLREKSMCDFDDLITMPLHVLEAGKGSCEFRHIIVDEYQDISLAQYRLLRGLAGGRARVCAVGDSDQAIYGFRGADIRSFLNFSRDYGEAGVVVLKENYRSTRVIVNAAGALIRNNRLRIEKALEATGESGGPVHVISAPDDKAEARLIVREIEARMGGTSFFRLDRQTVPTGFSEGAYSFSDFAVLFRTNGQAKALQEAFLEWGTPCQVVGDRLPLRLKALIEDARAYATGHETEGLDLEAVMARVNEGASLSTMEQAILTNLVAAYGDLPLEAALDRAVEELSVLGAEDAFDPRGDAVALMTLHTAKGLEFKVVFVAGVEEGLLPLRFGRQETDMEEERRLLYVGMTRAKEELFLTWVRSRFLHGRALPGSPSPFLSEIPPGLVRKESLPDKPPKKGGKQTGLFG
ncbi:MAG TPA: UvrD-helicase domain-containing protein [Syntrophorhabdales bacterium]|nr:UvrD-helicase domain-containing protein [Syntrophorhabdales bacterium]